MGEDTPHDRLIAALEAIAAAARDNARRNEAIMRRAGRLRDLLDDEVTVAEVMRREPGPPIVELLSANLATLQDAGATLRGVQAETLRAEGLTMAEIADLFGVTRQRVSSLLRASRRRAREGGALDGQVKPDAGTK